MAKQKFKTYKIFTTAMTGWIYEVKARNSKEAKEKMYDGEYFNEREDMEWEGDSGEEIYHVEEINKPTHGKKKK